MPYALAASPPPNVLPAHQGIEVGATVAVRTAGRGGISHERVGQVIRIYQNRRGVYFEVQEVGGKLLRVHPALIRALHPRGSK